MEKKQMLMRRRRERMGTGPGAGLRGQQSPIPAIPCVWRKTYQAVLEDL